MHAVHSAASLYPSCCVHLLRVFKLTVQMAVYQVVSRGLRLQVTSHSLWLSMACRLLQRTLRWTAWCSVQDAWAEADLFRALPQPCHLSPWTQILCSLMWATAGTEAPAKSGGPSPDWKCFVVSVPKCEGTGDPCPGVALFTYRAPPLLYHSPAEPIPSFCHEDFSLCSSEMGWLGSK